MNVKEKTKDNENARMDLEIEFKRGDLQLVPLSNGKMGMPKAKYTLTSADAKSVCR